VGLAAVTVAALNANDTTAAATLGAAWVGSMLPDADLPAARLYRRTLIERRVPLLALAGGLARLPVRVLALLPHRGLTHSLPACALATLLCGLLVSLAEPRLAIAAAAGAAIGYGTHVAADACTPSGVPVWAPFSRRHTWLLPAGARIRTGSPREYLILTLLTVVLAVAIRKLTT
jgi:inner membrane protein